MDWKQSQNGRSYTATTHRWQAMISKTTTGEWSALVSQRQNAVTHDVEDAQAWCETQIVETVDCQRNIGSHIITHNSLSGYRDCLDDEPISVGASIDLYENSLWVTGRYETNVQSDEALFVFDDNGQECTREIDHSLMHFRRSPQES